MDYYQCPIEDLRLELQRRDFLTYGNHDQFSESLRSNDEERGCEVTMVTTKYPTAFVPRQINLKRTVEFGQTAPTTHLVNQSARSFAKYPRRDN